MRGPVLAAATAGAAVLAAACASDGKASLTPDAQHQGGALPAKVTPVPSVSVEFTTPGKAEYRQAPDFTLNDRNGNPVSLSDFGDEPLIIEFAEGGCPPCNHETNKLAEFKQSGISVLIISNEDSGNFNRQVPFLRDPQMKVAELYGVFPAPTTVFVRGGKIVHVHPGFSQENSDLDKLTAAFMAGQDMDSVLATVTPEPTLSNHDQDAGQEGPGYPLIEDSGTLGLGVSKITISDTFRRNSDGGYTAAFLDTPDFKQIADKLREAAGLESSEAQNYRQILKIMDDSSKELIDFYCGPLSGNGFKQFVALSFVQAYGTIAHYKVQSYQEHGLLPEGSWLVFAPNFKLPCELRPGDLSKLEKHARG